MKLWPIVVCKRSDECPLTQLWLGVTCFAMDIHGVAGDVLVFLFVWEAIILFFLATNLILALNASF